MYCYEYMEWRKNLEYFPYYLQAIANCGYGKFANNCSACMQSNETETTSWCNSIDCRVDVEYNKCVENGNAKYLGVKR